MNPAKAAERLLFAVFGQSRNTDLIVMAPPERALLRPDWTKALFKVTFAIYMLVTVVVLIKLLIATMSDTYQQIQAQSDIQWKFGLSKLIRSIDRTTTAPSPINLITTWFFYFTDLYRTRAKKSMYSSPRSKASAKWLEKVRKKKEMYRRQSLTAHTVQFNNSIEQRKSVSTKLLTIDKVTDWTAISKKYRELMGLNKELDDLVEISPIEVFHLLFFAVFGQTSPEQLQTKKHSQTELTTALFKLVFGIYMLVSVVVLINLLIAMMSDTYQRIQAQSDIEWKYGLSKLIRKMHRTTTAPSPINLITTWLIYFIELCIAKSKKKKRRPNLIEVINTFQNKRSLSPRSKAAAKWLSKLRSRKKVAPQENTLLIPSHFSSPAKSYSEEHSHPTRIEHVVDWEIVANKYRAFMGYIDEVIDTTEE
ncbi:hypothetical protein FQA39_LY02639 [Lamprigera yunnana]|nr:hypothetical protein FQA39_LY02639 [Lamprigera yunnana]